MSTLWIPLAPLARAAQKEKEKGNFNFYMQGTADTIQRLEHGFYTNGKGTHEETSVLFRYGFCVDLDNLPTADFIPNFISSFVSPSAVTLFNKMLAYSSIDLDHFATTIAFGSKIMVQKVPHLLVYWLFSTDTSFNPLNVLAVPVVANPSVPEGKIFMKDMDLP